MDEIGQVRPVDIDAEMRAAYLDYAMSVIVSRALPDARDGLKPVHRRILYAMYDMGLRPNTPYRKSARIVGEVLGKYHPHGDQAVYDSMVRMAQDFSMRYPLVDGQGNFGSIDGDNAAAMRYTEARMYQLASEMLSDIDRETVNFGDNFDGSLLEPAVLPSALPNLLVNGASGIAVGMSTSIPPHNLAEVVDALVYMLDRWGQLEDIGVEDLMQFIKGPDFPTGGLIFRYRKNGKDALLKSYGTGRAKITVQARAHIEQLSRNRGRIIITELPYMANKTNLIEKIAALVRDEKIEGVTDLRDESDRQGMRIVIDTTRTADPEAILAQLYKKTPMRQTFSFIMLALVDGEPRMLTLKQALRVFVEHRIEVITRRSEYDLRRAKERAHILEGYITALDNLDAIIDTIRRSRTAETARNNLQRNFSLTEAQAQAILDMPLRRLAALERKKIEEEYQEKLELIEQLEELLAEPGLMRRVIKDELLALREEYGDARRSLIVDDEAGAVRMSEILPDEETWVIVTQSGRCSRTPTPDAPRITTAVDDPPILMRESVVSDLLYLFTPDGRSVNIPVHQLPKLENFEQGETVASLTALDDADEIAVALTLPPTLEAGYLFFTTQTGTVKRVTTEDLPGLVADAFTAIIVPEGDRLLDVFWTSGEDEVLLVSAEGKAIRFSEGDVRAMGLKANGVNGIKLTSEADRVVGVTTYAEGANLWVSTSNGEAKSSPMEDYPLQGRYGQGVITYKSGPESGPLAAATSGTTDDTIVVVTNKGKPKYMRFGYAPETGRNATGTEIIALSSGEHVTRVVKYQPRLAYTTEE